MNFWKKIFLFVLVCSVLTTPVLAEDIIGRLKKVTGSGHVIRNYEQVAAEDDVGIMLGDLLVTGSDGALGVIFDDESRITLGPNSNVKITLYIYNPQQGIFSFLLNKIKGTFLYISGAIGKLAPNSIRIRTPTAVVGIRGTFFLVKVDQSTEHPNLFVLMPDPETSKVGEISVTNDAGSVRLSKAHESVQIAAGQQPEDAVVLSKEKIQEMFNAALEAIPELKKSWPPPDCITDPLKPLKG
ncbi:MAG: hypothetical protein D3923_03935 [Candidatus Electrothrix sp. AR3]|nr:hypothetical protein [Candidatus Electrothrix sp. AR3]